MIGQPDRGAFLTRASALVAVCVAVSVTVSAMSGGGMATVPCDQAVAQAMVDPAAAVVDEAHQDSHDPETQTQRHARNEYYKGARPLPPDPEVSVIHTDGLHVGDAFPVDDSTLVVTAVVVRFQPYLVPDRSGIYTEFALCVEERFDTSRQHRAGPGDTLFVTRRGGRVRRSTGETYSLYVSGMESFELRVGRRYLLALSYSAKSGSYHPRGVYELMDGRAVTPGGRSLQMDQVTAGIQKQLRAPGRNGH